MQCVAVVHAHSAGIKAQQDAAGDPPRQHAIRSLLRERIRIRFSPLACGNDLVTPLNLWLGVSSGSRELRQIRSDALFMAHAYPIMVDCAFSLFNHCDL